MPRYADQKFFTVMQGDIIGLEDYIFDLCQDEEISLEDKEIPLTLFEADDYGRRRYSVMSHTNGRCMRLSIFDFQKMLIEFSEFANKLIQIQMGQLQKLIY